MLCRYVALSGLMLFLLSASPAVFAQEAASDGEPQIQVAPSLLTIIEPGRRMWTPPPGYLDLPDGPLADHVPGRVIVKLREGLSVDERSATTSSPAIDALGRQLGLQAMRRLATPSSTTAMQHREAGVDRIVVLEFPVVTDVRALVEAYSAMPGIEFAEPDYIAELDHAPPPDGARLTPNDPIYPLQWALNNTGQAIPHGGGGPVGTIGADINAEAAWDISTGGDHVVIAILDQGLELSHPEFAGRVVQGYDFVNNQPDPQAFPSQAHGTATTGVAAAAGNNGIGVAGVAWDILIMPLKVCQSGCPFSAITSALIHAADNGANVVNMSLGGSSGTAALENAVNYAHAAGVAIFASRGNHGTSAARFPASYANVISVGALSPCNTRKTTTSCDGETWWGSGWGGGMDFLSPGTRIHTTDNLTGSGYDPSSDYFTHYNGTSAASPFAAGVGALVLSVNPNLTPDEVRAIMQSSATDMGSPGYDDDTGFGRIDAAGALMATPGAGSFTITNVGEGTLMISSVTTDAGWLTVDPGPPISLEEGEQQLVEAVVDWSLLNEDATATITIGSNDPSQPEVTVDVSAIPFITPPLAAFSPSLDEGIDATLAPETTATYTLAISNEGEQDLEFTFPAFDGSQHVVLGHELRGAYAATGARDLFGYSWADSNEPGGPAFAWFDISSIGSKVNGLEGTWHGNRPVSLPFSFPFYGSDYSQARVSVNGWINFDMFAGLGFANEPIPTPGSPSNFIAVFWDNLDMRNAGAVYTYHDSANERFIVQWQGVPRTDDAGSSMTFQAQLFPDGEILIQYDEMVGNTETATVGIEAPGGEDGLEIVYNDEYVEDALAVRIMTPSTLVTDISPASGTVEPGATVEVTLTFDSSDLALGLHEGTVSIFTNEDGGTGYAYPVTLTVDGEPPVAAIDPDELTFVLNPDATASAIMNLSNQAGSSGVALQYVISVVDRARGAGEAESSAGRTARDAILTVEPASGSVPAGGSQELLVTVDSDGIDPGSTFLYDIVIATNDPENEEMVVPVEINVQYVDTGVEGEPLVFALEQNYPNPFTAQTTIDYSLAEAGPVTITVFDMTGRVVVTLLDAEMEAGRHTLTWDAHGVAAGVYFYRIRAGAFTETMRALIVR